MEPYLKPKSEASEIIYPGPAIRQSRLPGQNQHFRPQNGQRGRAEHKVEELRDTIAGYSFYLAVTGHLRREFPRMSAR